MLCCWKKTTEVKTLSKPLLAESKSVTGEPKIVTERRPPSVPVPIKTFPPPPPKLESAYSSLPPLPAPIYVKSELSPVELKPISIPVEIKSAPAPVTAPLVVKPVPVEVKPVPVEVKPVPAPVPATLPVEDNPVEIKHELAPIEAKPIQKKNFKSNKRI
jgi:hypothetical protein